MREKCVAIGQILREVCVKSHCLRQESPFPAAPGSGAAGAGGALLRPILCGPIRAGSGMNILGHNNGTNACMLDGHVGRFDYNGVKGRNNRDPSKKGDPAYEHWNIIDKSW